MASASPRPWIDRAIGYFAPRAALARERARVATDLIRAHYDGASISRRTMGWPRRGGDANAAIAYAAPVLREQARDLVRNNTWAAAMVETQANQVVGWGIKAAAEHEQWKQWAETTACDADGRCDLYGLQHLVWTTLTVSGATLIRRRWRRPEDGLPLPLQVQVLEPDYLDHTRDQDLGGGSRIIQGVEFDAIGRRVAYWLFRDHPGARRGIVRGGSVRVPASEVLHIYRQDRPGQVHGVTWFAPAIVRFRDLDEFEDATLVKQKIAACLAVFLSDVDGTGPPLGSTETDPATGFEVDSLEPGLVSNLPPHRRPEVVNPPAVDEYADYVSTQHRAVSASYGLTYEDMTGNYTRMPFSASRMSWVRHWQKVDGWRWKIVVPQMLDPVWGWAMEAAALAGLPVAESTRWTPPPMPFVDPQREGLAIMQNIRSGIQTHSEAIRERGYDPEQFVAELAADLERLARHGIVLDIDAGKMTQAGQALNKALLQEDGGAGTAKASAGLNAQELARRIVEELVARERLRRGDQTEDDEPGPEED